MSVLSKSNVVLTLLLTVAILLAGCEKRSDVGLNLVDQIGGVPANYETVPSVFEVDEFEEITGADPRVLTGMVNDPLVGSFSANGYIDFYDVTTTTAYKNSNVSAAWLSLVPDYVYGDTLTPVTVSLHEIQTSWTSSGVTSDTTINSGPEIARFTFMPTDTLIRVDLPADWVTRQDTTLRSTTFGSSFYGFELRPQGGNAIVGFAAAGTFLNAATPADTVAFPTVATQVGTTVRKTITTFRANGNTNLPTGLTLLQDTRGEGIRVDFDISDPAFAGQALNKVLMVLAADTLTVENTPAGFVRPQLTAISLLGVTSTGTKTAISDFLLGEDGQFNIASNKFNIALSPELLNEPTFDYYILAPLTSAANTVSVMLIHNRDSSKGPRALFTLTPLD